jgi:sugar phosphate isomerase/epimerase
MAMAKNVKIAVELLPRSCIGNTASELLSIVNKVDSPFVGICLDVNHLMDKYETSLEVIKP